MSELVEAVIVDPRWRNLGLGALAERACRAALAQLGLEPEGFEIALLGAGDARLAELNADFRGKPQPTNVLSWPAEERSGRSDGAAPDLPVPGTGGPEILGDIALGYETCVAEAVASGLEIGDHVTHLVVHGCLHLLGYDHQRDGDATLMEGLEIEILASLGVANPYR